MPDEHLTHQCEACGYVYRAAHGDPDGDVAAGTAWEDLAADWRCPNCGAAKHEFMERDDL